MLKKALAALLLVALSSCVPAYGCTQPGDGTCMLWDNGTANNAGAGTYTFGAVTPIKTSGAVPTSCSSTGLGTSPTCTFSTGSTSQAGRIVMTTGTGSPASTGTVTVNLAAAFGVNVPACTYTLSNSTTNWNARATVFDNQPGNATTISAVWDNNSVALTISSGYVIDYVCFGK